MRAAELGGNFRYRDRDREFRVLDWIDALEHARGPFGGINRTIGVCRGIVFAGADRVMHE